MLDAAEVERRTGWRIVAYPVVASTNDEVAALRDAGFVARLAVIADRQLAGRGRGGRRFESPVGGLYASLLVSVRVADLPAPLIAAVAVSMAEAIEAIADVRVSIKWPNDLWIEQKKVAGILTEASLAASQAMPRTQVIIGVGVNLVSVPVDLPVEVARLTTALDLHARTATRREDLLAEFLHRLDDRVVALERLDARAGLEAAYRSRLAMRGERIQFLSALETVTGVLEDASLDRGILVRDGVLAPRWWSAATVRDVRAAGA